MEDVEHEQNQKEIDLQNLEKELNSKWESKFQDFMDQSIKKEE